MSFENENGGAQPAGQDSQVNSNAQVAQGAEGSQGAYQPTNGQQENVQSGAQGSQISDDSFEHFFNSRQNFYPQAAPVSPQYGYPPQYSNPYSLPWGGQPQQPTQQQSVPAQPQVESQQQIKDVEIDYKKLSSYAEDGNYEEFVKSINDIVKQQTGLTAAQQKAEMEKLLQETVSKEITAKIQAQEAERTVQTIVSGVEQELQKNGINLNQWEKQALISQGDEIVPQEYNAYLYNFNMQRQQGLISPYAQPMTGIDFAIKYMTKIAQSRYTPARNMNTTQQGTPNNAVRPTFTPVMSGQPRPGGLQKTEQDRLAEWNSI